MFNPPNPLMVLKESTDGVSTGNLLDVAVLGQRTNLLQSKYQLDKLQNQVSDLTGDLNDLRVLEDYKLQGPATWCLVDGRTS